MRHKKEEHMTRALFGVNETADEFVHAIAEEQGQNEYQQDRKFHICY